MPKPVRDSIAIARFIAIDDHDSINLILREYTTRREFETLVAIIAGLAERYGTLWARNTGRSFDDELRELAELLAA